MYNLRCQISKEIFVCLRIEEEAGLKFYTRFKVWASVVGVMVDQKSAQFSNNGNDNRQILKNVIIKS